MEDERPRRARRARLLWAGTAAGAIGGSTRRGRVAPSKVRASNLGSPARHRPGSGPPVPPSLVRGARPAHRSRAGARTLPAGSALPPAWVRGRCRAGARSLPRGCADAPVRVRLRGRLFRRPLPRGSAPGEGTACVRSRRGGASRAPARAGAPSPTRPRSPFPDAPLPAHPGSAPARSVRRTAGLDHTSVQKRLAMPIVAGKRCARPALHP